MCKKGDTAHVGTHAGEGSCAGENLKHEPITQEYWRTDVNDCHEKEYKNKRFDFGVRKKNKIAT